MSLAKTSSKNLTNRTIDNLSSKFDFMQALTGVLLVLFIFGHLILVSSVIISPSIMNGIAWVLNIFYLEEIVAITIFLIIVAHFVLAARKMPFRTGELITFYEHSKSMKHKETWAWLVQVITAVILIILVFTHIFNVIGDLPITAQKSAIRMQDNTIFYFVFLFATWLHTGIGIFRLGVKYGYITSTRRQEITKKLAILILVCICIGLLAELKYSMLTI